MVYQTLEEAVEVLVRGLEEQELQIGEMVVEEPKRIQVALLLEEQEEAVELLCDS
jgi:hypothetical protein